MPATKKSQGIDTVRSISGSAIAMARLKRKWTQSDLAARSGISRETIAYRERSVLVRGRLAQQFDKAFGGAEWRISGTRQHKENKKPPWDWFPRRFFICA